MNGIFVLDKPEGMTSRKALDETMDKLKVKRAGHTGTLDPFATGVLPVCIGDATKIIPFLDEEFKQYEAVLRLGISTDTLDLTGQITKKKEIGEIDRRAILDVFSRFLGKIEQIPPMYSAVKKNGTRLYKLARQGKEVERPPRAITIRDLVLLEFDYPFLKFLVNCSRGTYVRVLGADIGEELGTGGHLTELRRTASGKFRIEDAISLQELSEDNVKLISMNQALSHMKGINVSDEISNKIRNGMQVKKAFLSEATTFDFKPGERIRVHRDSDLVSVAEALVNSRDLDKLNKGEIVLRLVRVFN